ncbi:NAD-dependent epimerase/dehydratase family protein [Spirosoma linguale]|uniref:NAD-dependent epimerase/dehydratase n=1 Tax=Spirosoma linguale (strain ATCC 33905 / DSM 74 / LMG 10896 / Claus 1) TaxID=504472 RepID=D2QSA0_SPILD|nr:NAD-dependent epimerase/dehydratase [Spirosoma linguale DSM 74]
MNRQTILGAGGVIATEVARQLLTYTDTIRLVSRNPKAVNPTDELVQADLTDAQQTDKAVAGSDIVYLVAGLPYKTSIWQENWPKVMQNTIDACERHGAKLVFFDNVYMYGRVSGWMTEETPFNPISKKGEVRAQIARMLLDAMQAGRVTALIARSADFYGPNVPNSVTEALVFSKLRAGKTANWLVNAQVKHSITLVADAGRGTVVLGNTPDAYGQTWHLPTDRQALTGHEFIGQAAAAYGVKPNYSVLSNWMVWLGGLFNPVVGETREMLYQSDSDYLFDSSKFENRFFPATSYSEGIKQSAV